MGYGLGMSVVADAAGNGVVSSNGEYCWCACPQLNPTTRRCVAQCFAPCDEPVRSSVVRGGMASTVFFVDPAEDLVVVEAVMLPPCCLFSCVAFSSRPGSRAAPTTTIGDLVGPVRYEQPPHPAPRTTLLPASSPTCDSQQPWRAHTHYMYM